MRAVTVAVLVFLGCAAARNEGASAMDEPIRRLKVTIGGKPLASLDAAAVRAAVVEYNRQPQTGRPEIPDAVNPRCLSADEAVAFVEALPRLPRASQKALAGEAVELADEGLKLHPVDGFGVNALRGEFTVERKRGAWIVQPAPNRADVEAELGAALGVVNDKSSRRAEAEKALAGMERTSPDYPPRFRALATLKQEQALAWSVALQLVRMAAPVAPLTVAGERWEATRIQREQEALEANMRTAPAVGGMPGGAPGGGMP